MALLDMFAVVSRDVKSKLNASITNGISFGSVEGYEGTSSQEGRCWG